MNQSAEAIKQSLFSLTAKGIKYDLDRICAAAVQAGNPHTAYASIHVAGTNGKGSTCAFIESVLRKAGFTTGLFTSPHISAFEERFRINGVPVSEEEWVAVYDELRVVISSFNLTFFEATMLIGSELFRRRNVDWAIFETGLGGRLDATNILMPRVSVVTHLAMDHADLLGNTIAAVASEKLGIVKKGIPLVIAESGDAEVCRLIDETCRERKSPCAVVSAGDATDVVVSPAGVMFSRDGIRYTIRLTGRFQIINALLAIEAIARTGLVIPEETLVQGIAAAAIEGRFQQLQVRGKKVILDVGHNPDAAEALCAALDEQFKSVPICLVAGIMADKDYPAMIARYAATARHLILTRPDTERAALAEMLARHAPDDRHTVYVDVASAVSAALERDEEVICITGSFFTVGEAVRCFPV
jgi:dihydrofolate synthase/folylpolyglutamate synthase